MTLNQMRIFVAVCHEGSATKAAEKLFIAQSAVSRTLSLLSGQYGFQMFDRIDGRLKPTATALELLGDIEPLLDLYYALENKLTNKGYTPALSIGCSMATGSFLIPEVILLFEDKFPDTKLFVFENHTTAIEESLLTGDLDLGIIAGSIHSPKLAEEVFDTEDFYWVCSADHPIVSEGQVSLKRLAQERLYLPGRDISGLEMLDQYALKEGVELRPMWNMVNVSASLSAVLSGRCISLCSYRLVKEYIQDGRVVTIPVSMKITRNVSAVYLRRKRLSKEARAFIDLCALISNQSK